MRVRLNLICLAGAILGVVCVLLPWAVASLHLVGDGNDNIHYQLDLSPSRFFKNSLDEHLLNLEYAAAFFAIGSLAAFFTPFGGLGQLAGIVIFGLKLKDSLYYMLPVPRLIIPQGYSWQRTYDFSIGYYLAILAAAFTLASLIISVRTVLPGSVKPKVSIRSPIRERLLSIGISRRGS